MTLRATGRHVLVCPLPERAVSRGGIVLAEDYRQPSGRGVIMSVGGRVNNDALKAGVIVHYSWIDGRTVEFGEDRWQVLDAGLILGISE